MHVFTKTATLAAGALLAVLTSAAGPADAAPRPLVDWRGASVGSYVLDDAGAAHLSGEVSGMPFDGSYTGTLAADDGSLPAPGECEPGTATLEVSGSRDRFVDLVATGRLCGAWADPTYVVTHEFVGSYDVAASSVKRLRGTDGWISEILATEGRANVEAIDT